MILGMMSIGQSTCGGQFPLWGQCLLSMCDLCDKVIVRWDSRSGDPAARDAIQELCGDKLVSLIIGAARWNRFNWRESMLREIDNRKLTPSIVLTPDQDEEFGAGIKDDLERLEASKYSALMFRYEMVTADNARVPIYPRRPHMKAFKWIEGLTYRPYLGFAIVRNYRGIKCRMSAVSKMQHYCYYTPELRKRRRIAI